jgi:hypothetical protein
MSDAVQHVPDGMLIDASLGAHCASLAARQQDRRRPLGNLRNRQLRNLIGVGIGIGIGPRNAENTA